MTHNKVTTETVYDITQSNKNNLYDEVGLNNNRHVVELYVMDNEYINKHESAPTEQNELLLDVQGDKKYIAENNYKYINNYIQLIVVTYIKLFIYFTSVVTPLWSIYIVNVLNGLELYMLLNIVIFVPLFGEVKQGEHKCICKRYINYYPIVLTFLFYGNNNGYLPFDKIITTNKDLCKNVINSINVKIFVVWSLSIVNVFLEKYVVMLTFMIHLWNNYKAKLILFDVIVIMVFCQLIFLSLNYRLTVLSLNKLYVVICFKNGECILLNIHNGPTNEQLYDKRAIFALQFSLYCLVMELNTNDKLCNNRYKQIENELIPIDSVPHQLYDLINNGYKKEIIFTVGYTYIYLYAYYVQGYHILCGLFHITLSSIACDFLHSCYCNRD